MFLGKIFISENIYFLEELGENGGAILRSGGVSSEAFDNRNISRHFALRSSDLARRDDRARDRVVMAASMDRARLSRPPEQVPVPLDSAAGVRGSAALVCVHGSLCFLGLPYGLVEF